MKRKQKFRLECYCIFSCEFHVIGYILQQDKDAKLQEALKSKKKAMKKQQQLQNQLSPGKEKSLASLEAENGRLKEREQALMEAVEELSLQNEDLIIKLRESMQRELELR